MGKTSERLRFLALHMMASDCDMLLPSGCINPEDAADLLDEAEKALSAIAERSRNGELGTSKVIDMRRIAEDALARIRGEK